MAPGSARPRLGGRSSRPDRSCGRGPSRAPRGRSSRSRRRWRRTGPAEAAVVLLGGPGRVVEVGLHLVADGAPGASGSSSTGGWSTSARPTSSWNRPCTSTRWPTRSRAVQCSQGLWLEPGVVGHPLDPLRKGRGQPAVALGDVFILRANHETGRWGASTRHFLRGTPVRLHAGDLPRGTDTGRLSGATGARDPGDRDGEVPRGRGPPPAAPRRAPAWRRGCRRTRASTSGRCYGPARRACPSPRRRPRARRGSGSRSARRSCPWPSSCGPGRPAADAAARKPATAAAGPVTLTR